jgi:hypothetical protein
LLLHHVLLSSILCGEVLRNDEISLFTAPLLVEGLRLPTGSKASCYEEGGHILRGYSIVNLYSCLEVN